MNDLKTTLQNAGQMQPNKPKIAPYEDILIKEVKKNPYASALLYMIIAGNKEKFAEQKFTLNKALGIFKDFIINYYLLK